MIIIKRKVRRKQDFAPVSLVSSGISNNPGAEFKAVFATEAVLENMRRCHSIRGFLRNLREGN